MHTAQSLRDAISQKINWLENFGFRFFKSLSQYRKPINGGYSYIDLNVVASNQSECHIAFYIGVRFDAVEKIIKQISKIEPKLTHYNRTITFYTYNIGPQSPHWYDKEWGFFAFNKNDDPIIFDEWLHNMISKKCLPYLNHHEKIENIRDTLLNNRKITINLYPFKQVFAIDIVLNNIILIESDYKMLSQDYLKLVEERRTELEEFYLKTKSFIKE